MGLSRERVAPDVRIYTSDTRLGPLLAMAREADRREGLHGAQYERGWQDAIHYLVKVVFPWHDSTAHATILAWVNGEVIHERV